MSATRSQTTMASSRKALGAALGLVLAVAAAPFLSPASAAQPTGDTVAAAETAAVAGANATDPAIWVNPADPTKSMIVGADDVRLVTYDMTGAVKAQAALPAGTTAGNFTGVDSRNGVMVNGTASSVIAAVGNGKLHFYTVDPATDVLTDVTATAGGIDMTQYWHSGKASDVCLYQSPLSNTTFAFLMAKSGEMEQIELAPTAAGKIDIKAPVRGGKTAATAWDLTSTAGSQPGGCVVDDATRTLYYSEASVGIWKIGAEPTDAKTATAVDGLASGGGHLLASTKGLAIVKTSDTAGYVIASTFDAIVKGNPVPDGSFNVYDRETGAFIRSFKVIAGQAADNCQASDGIEAAAGSFGATFANGLFLCQDLKNRVGANGAGDEDQNFKMVPLDAIVDMTAPVATTTTTAPATPPTSAPDQVQVPHRSGYWMVGSDGRVYNFGQAASYGDATMATGAQAVDLEPTPSGNGYWIVDNLGHVFARGDALSFGDVDKSLLKTGEFVTSLSATPTGKGYWAFTTAGRVISFGDALPYGDMSQVKLNGPVLDSIPSASGKGYYMVASDGGIFTFGDAVFKGSMGDKPLNKPVQSLVPDADGSGYWLVAADGGIFAFDAPFQGSMGAVKLNKPVTGMVRFGNGYLMVAEDGGIFSFSDKKFYGSLGDHPPANPITSVAVLDAP